MDCHHPKWRTQSIIFQRGLAATINQIPPWHPQDVVLPLPSQDIVRMLLGRRSKQTRVWWRNRKPSNNWKNWYGYGSIPINTIFRGMNIHESQLFWCELQGYYWFWHTAIWNHCSNVMISPILGHIGWIPRNCQQSSANIGISQKPLQLGKSLDLENCHIDLEWKMIMIPATEAWNANGEGKPQIAKLLRLVKYDSLARFSQI